MIAMLRHEANALILEDMKGNPTLKDACLSILDFISEHPPEQLNHITFRMLTNITGFDQIAEVLPVVTYLTGARVPLLTPFFEFVDGDDTDHITLEEVESARRDKAFFNPRTGEPVEDFEKRLFMHFELSDEGRQVAGVA